MGEFAGFDLDRSTARAWSRFQARLADHIAEMQDDDVLVIDVEAAEEPGDGAAPYVQFCAFGGGMVRGEVSGNTYLAEQHRLSVSQRELLEWLDWSPPAPEGNGGEGRGNYFRDVALNEADRLAVMTVRTLREVFGVAHPAFLAADGLGAPLDEPPDVPGADPEEPQEPLAVAPADADDLRGFVDAALVPLFGDVPEKDEDGDIPVPWGSSLVFVRVNDDVPMVELFGVLADDISDVERARIEVGILNRDVRFIKFLLIDRRVIAQVQLPAAPFAPEHLRTMLVAMSHKLDQIDDDLVARIGGRRAFEPAEEPQVALRETAPDEPRAADSEDSTLQTLLELDAEGTGALDPELAAGVCGFDRSVIVRLLHETGEQEIAWRKARDAALLVGDQDEADSCDHEMRAWENTSVVLRKALRFVVERELGREPTPDTGYEAAEEVRRTGPRPRARKHRPRRPPRPARLRLITNAGDLLRAHGCGGLVELDGRLTEISEHDIEAFDMDDCIELHVGDKVWQLGYPFTMAQFHELLAEIEESDEE
ncbi:MAG TPA: hypothetical protein VLA97_08010 [Nocardioidaceae bacterium]|nr:hypothetical protein [Nocardioidaceae bacterium]